MSMETKEVEFKISPKWKGADFNQMLEVKIHVPLAARVIAESIVECYYPGTDYTDFFSEIIRNYFKENIFVPK